MRLKNQVPFANKTKELIMSEKNTENKSNVSCCAPGCCDSKSVAALLRHLAKFFEDKK
jgi:hypothetical protein